MDLTLTADPPEASSHRVFPSEVTIVDIANPDSRATVTILDDGESQQRFLVSNGSLDLVFDFKMGLLVSEALFDLYHIYQGNPTKEASQQEQQCEQLCIDFDDPLN